MGKAAKNLMGGGRGRQGKVAIKKTVNRGGKSFQQTFYVSPQEAAAMQKKAAKEHDERQKRKPKKDLSNLTRKADTEFEKARNKHLFKLWTTPLDKEGKKRLPVPPPPEQHVEIAKKALDSHRKSLPEKIQTLKSLAPKGAIVKGRVKEVESAVGKVQRKPKYGTADKLQDLTGTRVIMNTSNEVLDTVKKLHEKYEILEEDDYITPIEKRKFPNEAAKAKTAAVMKPGYRSYHMIAKDKRGNVFEIQLRTRDQNTFAEWSHDVYKPRNRSESDYVKKHSKSLNDYGVEMSTYFARREGNPKLPAPPCPTVIAQSPFGCMET